MDFHGKNFIGAQLSALGEKTLKGFNPRTGTQTESSFHQATDNEIDQALQLAALACPAMREAAPSTIAGFLDQIAMEIEKLGDGLIEQAATETGLLHDRLLGERGRTVNQLRLFAALVRDGSFVDARIDPALPDRKPLPRPDLRRMLIPIGPVVVFGASNFPLAFSVAGGDTVSAFAAKNPIVFKAHPAHPGTSELVAGAIARAVTASGLPAGAFSMVHAVDPAVSLTLVRHPLSKAVAFTGSQRAGMAIFEAASRRPEPIPAYVEMGSVNPVFVLPGALQERADALAQGLTNSINFGVGQFCTCPGLIFLFDGEGSRGFREKLGSAFALAAPATMLHPGILSNYEQSVARVRKIAGAETSARQSADRAKTEAAPTIFETDAATWLQNEVLAEEVFGPSATVVVARSEDELLKIAASLPGTLTATVHGTPEDLRGYRNLVSALEAKCGRLIFNGYPTGVEVSPAMHHGGPFPATADPKFTSVGTASILRFLRPICYQNFPDESLPPELQAANPRKIWRTIDGQVTREPLHP